MHRNSKPSHRRRESTKITCTPFTSTSPHTSTHPCIWPRLRVNNSLMRCNVWTYSNRHISMASSPTPPAAVQSDMVGSALNLAAVFFFILPAELFNRFMVCDCVFYSCHVHDTHTLRANMLCLTEHVRVELEKCLQPTLDKSPLMLGRIVSDSFSIKKHQ